MPIMQRGKSFQRENIPGGEYSKVDRRENHQEGNCDKFYVRDIIPEGSYDKSFEGENVLVDFIHRGRKCQGGVCARGDNVCQPNNLFTYCASHKHFVPDKR